MFPKDKINSWNMVDSDCGVQLVSVLQRV